MYSAPDALPQVCNGLDYLLMTSGCALKARSFEPMPMSESHCALSESTVARRREEIGSKF